MTAYVLIPGAGGAAWYWHRIVPLLEKAGHQAIAVDLPADDERAGLTEYAQLVTEAAAGHDDVVLVAQSLGGFTAPLAAGRLPLRGLVLVNAMIPVPGETPGAWWADTGWEQARIAAAERGGYPAEFDEPSYFLHDVPPEVLASGAGQQHPEAAAVFGSVCDFAAWPSVPVRVLAGADDRFFPAEFQRRVARDRLGLAADVRPGGHLIALSQPEGLAGYLLGR
jgi:pimeloyl-ACP methyl ester carboxylesterase